MIELDGHVGWFVLGGVALLAMTVLPQRFAARPLSLPIVYVVGGYLAFRFAEPLRGFEPLTSDLDAAVIEYGTELIVIVSLAAAGLKLDRSVGFVSWASVWRLLGITMPLTVLAAVALGQAVLGVGLGAAILLGAVLAPTDPVLADDVQVDEPGDDVENEVRFTLTAEAGLNDGLAFPISYLAVAVAASGSVGPVAGDWIATDVVYRVAVGVAVGWLLGRVLVRFTERSDFPAAVPSAGLFVLGATIVVYGLAELVNGYGFLAVFVAALARGTDRFRSDVSAFADVLERMLLAFVLIGFGALLAGGVLASLTWQGAAVGALLVLVVRPLAGLLGLIGSPLPGAERGAIAFLGIRGMGSLYYLAWATNRADFGDDLDVVWATVSFTVLLSIVVHGVTASPLMRCVERRRTAGRPIAHPPIHPLAHPPTARLDRS